MRLDKMFTGVALPKLPQAEPVKEGMVFDGAEPMAQRAFGKSVSQIEAELMEDAILDGLLSDMYPPTEGGE